MIFVIFALATVVPLYKYSQKKFPTIKRIYAIFVAILLPIALSLLIGTVVTEFYYASDMVQLQYEEIDVHYSTPIELEQYVSQEPVVLMDKEHNLYHIDLDKAEITFSTNNYAAYIKTEKAKGIWKFIVLDQKRTSYALQFLDYSLRKW